MVLLSKIFNNSDTDSCQNTISSQVPHITNSWEDGEIPKSGDLLFNRISIGKSPCLKKMSSCNQTHLWHWQSQCKTQMVLLSKIFNNSDTDSCHNTISFQVPHITNSWEDGGNPHHEVRWSSLSPPQKVVLLSSTARSNFFEIQEKKCLLYKRIPTQFLKFQEEGFLGFFFFEIEIYFEQFPHLN